MGLLNILYVEDNERDWGRPFLEFAEDSSLVAKWVKTYVQLEQALSEGNRAKLYVVDGNFPRNLGGREEKLAEEAIQLIRVSDPNSPRILILSSDSSMQELSGKLGVHYLDKFDGMRQIFEYFAKLD